MKKLMILITTFTLSSGVIAQHDRMMDNDEEYNYWGMHIGWWLFMLVIVIVIVVLFFNSRNRK